MGVDAERECWELRSGAGVGPLQFGMSPAEVAQALLVLNRRNGLAVRMRRRASRMG
ncbi:hypothetical protein KE639_00115 [Streptomyces sp. V17-9]|nr:hypothetical protein KE639_00115 [Streptomyces sp. V17-9]